MGLKDKLKGLTEEKQDFGNAKYTKSLSEEFGSWASGKSEKQQKIIDRVLLAIGCVLVVGLIGYGVYTVYGKPADKESSLFTATGNVSGSNSNSNSNSATSSKTDNSGYFENLNSWSFLGTHKKETANNIYDQLLDAGMEKRTTVYCFSDVSESGNIHVCYVKLSKTSKYYQVNVLSDYTTTIKEIEQKDLPNQEEIQELEKKTKEEEERRNALNANIEKDTNTTQENSNADPTNTAQQIQLSDTAALAKVLPINCANLMSDSLTKAMKSNYGFNAIPEASKVNQYSISTTGTNTTFVVLFVDSDRNTLLMNITYDDSNQTFSGQRIQQ